MVMINNGNRTEWTPIRSVIIRVINNLLITSIITDRIGRHDVLLPINHNHYNFRKTESFNWKKTFNRNISKFTSGKISPAETLSKVTNSAVLEKPQP